MQNLLFLLIVSFIYQSTTYSHENFSSIPDEFKAEKVAIVGIQYNDYHLDMLNLISKDMDITGVDLKSGHIDVAVSSEQLKLLKTQYEVIVRTEKSFFLAPDTEYQNPQEIEDFLKDMNERFPDISKLVSVATLLKGETFGRSKFQTIQKLMKWN